MNQLCRVCGELAAGFHFGAFTCEGCKSFFGRTCNNLSSLGDCKNNGKCIIDRKNRTSCKPCRLKKCIRVGMSKSGSRYGRRSNWFKIHCLLQDQAASVSSTSDINTPSLKEAKDTLEKLKQIYTSPDTTLNRKREDIKEDNQLPTSPSGTTTVDEDDEIVDVEECDASDLERLLSFYRKTYLDTGDSSTVSPSLAPYLIHPQALLASGLDISKYSLLSQMYSSFRSNIVKEEPFLAFSKETKDQNAFSSDFIKDRNEQSILSLLEKQNILSITKVEPPDSESSSSSETGETRDTKAEVSINIIDSYNQSHNCAIVEQNEPIDLSIKKDYNLNQNSVFSCSVTVTTIKCENLDSIPESEFLNNNKITKNIDDFVETKPVDLSC